MSIEHYIGRLLRPVRPGPSKLASARKEFQGVTGPMVIESPAFACGTHMSPRFTAVGKGVSPPLHWAHLPPHTKDLVLIVEDADPPVPRPIVHAVAYNIPASTHGLAEGSIPAHAIWKKAPQPEGFLLGKNTKGGQSWIEPRPVAGHGPHRYYFQLFAVTGKLDFKTPPTKVEILRAISGNVLGVAKCIGVFERE